MYIGIDIGGTNTRLGLFSSLSSPNFTLLHRFPTEPEYEAQLERINTLLQSSGLPTLDGIGVSFGGRMRKDGRAVAVAHNLPAFEGRPFADDLERHWHCPVRLAHDPVCGLIGECDFGVLQGADLGAYVTLSTGTGAALQLRSVEKAFALSIEFGHQVLADNPRVCICGQVGCLETYTGGRQLEQRLGYALRQVEDPDFWHVYVEKLALGLLNLVQLTRVEVVAISGAIALYNPSLLPLTQERLKAMLRGATVDLRMATLGEDAPLVGAMRLLTLPADAIIHF